LWPGGGTLCSHSSTHLQVLYRQRLAVQAMSLNRKYEFFLLTDIGQGPRVRKGMSSFWDD
jgi:hypothetical protein